MLESELIEQINRQFAKSQNLGEVSQSLQFIRGENGPEPQARRS